MLKVEFNATQLQTDLEQLPSRLQRAMVRSLNRGITSGRAFMVAEIARDTGLRAKDVREAIRIRHATAQSPEARLSASTKRLPLMKFRAKALKRGGVSYRLPGSRGRHPNAFIARMPTGHEGVFVRKTRRRLPIRELFGPSIGGVFARYRQAALARATDSFHKNLDHELTFARSRGGNT